MGAAESRQAVLETSTERAARGWAGGSNPPLAHSAVPAPPVSLSLGLAAQPPALRAVWSPPAGGRDGFLLRLYCLRPPALEGQDTLGPEVQTFSWTRLAPGTEFLVWLATLRGPDESSAANATGWTRECPAHPTDRPCWVSRGLTPEPCGR